MREHFEIDRESKHFGWQMVRTNILYVWEAEREVQAMLADDNTQRLRIRECRQRVVLVTEKSEK